MSVRPVGPTWTLSDSTKFAKLVLDKIIFAENFLFDNNVSSKLTLLCLLYAMEQCILFVDILTSYFYNISEKKSAYEVD